MEQSMNVPPIQTGVDYAGTPPRDVGPQQSAVNDYAARQRADGEQVSKDIEYLRSELAHAEARREAINAALNVIDSPKAAPGL